MYSGTSQSAVQAFRLHLWHLTSEMVPLALWSSKVPDIEQRALADYLVVKPNRQMLKPQNRFRMRFVKPKFLTALTLISTFADIAGIDSWFTLHQLDPNPAFLIEKVADWPLSAAYEESLGNLQALRLTTTALSLVWRTFRSDFLSAANGEEHFKCVASCSTGL